eukprot:gene22566-42895_t
MLAYLSTHPALLSADHDYTVFTAQPDLPPRAKAAVGKDVVKSYQSDEAEKVLAPVSKFLLRHGINAKTDWKVGHAGALIAKTAAWGALAGFFAVLGQGWLEDARPIFPFIQQNYALWQTVYLLALVLVFVLWAVAMQQKITILHNSKVGRAAQQRVVDFNARQAQ